MASNATPGKITDWVDPKEQSGEFRRQRSSFRSWISRDPGAEFPPEKGRYHLFVSYACPWAHRTLIVRKLKKLEDIISFSVVHWHLGEKGWRFPKSDETDAPGENVHPSPIPGHESFTHLRDLYFESDPDYAARFTVPVLYDKQRHVIVSNESAEIVRMLNSEFNDQITDPAVRALDLYPPHLRADIDAAEEWHYNAINNGVYKTGFATTQDAYDRNVASLFEALDRAEAHLARQMQGKGKEAGGETTYWFGSEQQGGQLTEVDVRLWVTLIRFDPVYVQHFKCNVRDVRSGYPALHRWMRELYWRLDAFHDTTNMLHIKHHYTKSHAQINKFAITPRGPLPDVLPLDEEVAAVRGTF